MTPGIGRAELQRLAEEKFADAELLCAAGRFSNAYYLAGYAVEIGLKAVIARQIAAETLPDPRFVRSIYTHALTELVVAAGMTSDLKARARTDPALGRNWVTASSWSEAARYRQWDGASAQAMIEAVGSTHRGTAMDPFVLVRPNIVGGLALIDYLDRNIGEIRAALWVREDFDQPWRLWIAPARRDVDWNGFVDTVIRITHEHDRELARLMAHDVKLISADHPAMPHLRIIAPVDGTPPISLTNHLLGSFFLPEAVVLRMR